MLLEPRCLVSVFTKALHRLVGMLNEDYTHVSSHPIFSYRLQVHLLKTLFGWYYFLRHLHSSLFSVTGTVMVVDKIRML